MKTNFRKFLAFMLATLMVISAFGTMATAVDQSECTHRNLDGSSAWSDVAEVEASCTKQGYTLRECAICRKLEAYNFENYTEHVYVETIVKAPGCAHRTKDEDKYGLKRYTCACGDSYDVTIAPIDFVELTAENIANGTWEETWKLIQDPNVKCGEYADSYYQCQNVGSNPDGEGNQICGFTSEHVIEVKQHDYKPADVAHKLPTCQEYGLITYTCQNDNCPEKEIDVKIAKLDCANEEDENGNPYHSLVSHVDATCMTPASDTYHCSKCDVTWTVVGEKDPDGHAWDNGVVTDSTCSEAGNTLYTCTNGCGATMTEPIDMKDHTPEIVPGKEPTCTEDGYTAGSKCSVCGATLVSSVVIPALGHKEETIPGYDATCTDDGLTDGVKCSVCGEILKEQVVIPALGHDYESVVTEPTCSKDGYTTHTCTVCGDTYTDTPVASTGCEWSEWEVISEGDCNSKSVEERVCLDPNCDGERSQIRYGDYGDHPAPPAYEEYVDGRDDDIHGEHTNASYLNNKCMIRYTCAECGELIEKVDPKGHRDLETHLVIEAATCNKPGRYADHCKECDYWYFYELNDHETVVVIDAAVAPGCESTGLTQGSHCDTCGAIIVAQEVVPALGHNYLFDASASKPATCDAWGTNAYKCENCGEYRYERLEPLGHTPGAAATCTEDQTCTVCGEVLNEKLGHTPGAAATCTEDQTCTVCGEVLNEKLGHDEVTYAAQAPDCTNIGWDSYVACSRCDYSTYVELPALGHTEEEIPAFHGNCFTEGTTAGVKCSVCDEILVAPEKTGINNEYHPIESYTFATYPTCDTNGTANLICNVCDTYDKSVEFELIPDALKPYYEALGHSVLGTTDPIKTVVTAATCISTGLEEYFCDKDHTVIVNGQITTVKCGYKLGEKVLDIDPTNHVNKIPHPEGILVYDDATGEIIKSYKREPSCNYDGALWFLCDCAALVETEVGSKIDHTWDKQNGTFIPGKAPTCTEEGYASTYEYPCLGSWLYVEYDYETGEYKKETWYCTHTHIEDAAILPELGHSTVNVPGKAPTCTEEGLTVGVVCDRCGVVITEQKPIPATGHNVVITGFTAPTCTENGIFTAVCTNCGKADYTQEEIITLANIPEATYKAHGHNYQLIESKPANCTSQGEDVFSCTYCRDRKSTIYEALGHFPGAEATCTEDQICLDCGEVIVPALGHDFDIVVTDPTCTTDGYTTYTCTQCGETFVDDAVKTEGHKYDVVTVPATCDQYGHNYYTCSVCGHEYAENIAPNGHSFDVPNVVEPICDGEGFTYNTCSVCGAFETAYDNNGDEYLVKYDFVPALGHDFVETYRYDSTCIVAGYVTYTCANGCGTAYNEDLDLAPHEPFEWNEKYICYDHIKAPTCSEEGVGFGSYCKYGYGTEDQHCASGENLEDACNEAEGHNPECLKHHFIPKLDHDEIDVSGKLSCTTAGFTYFMCQYCGEGHGLNGAAIVDEDGNYVEGLIVDYVHPIGHQADGGKAPTCTEPGYTGDKCKECGEELTDIEVIPPTNHPNLDWHNPEKREDECPDCGEMINVHGDYFVDDPTEREVWEYIDENICRYTKYTIEYCTKEGCDYYHINIIDMRNEKHEYENVSHVDATVSADGSDVYECKKCHHQYTETIGRIENTVEFTFNVGTIDADGNFVEGGKVVNGGKAAIQVDMAAYDVAMTQLMLTLKIDTTVLTFDERTTTGLNAGNGFINRYEYKNGYVRAISSYDATTNGGDFIIDEVSGQDYLTLVFDVATTAYEKDAKFVSTLVTEFSANLTNTAIVEDGAAPVNYLYVEDTEVIDIYKNADVSGDGVLDLTDAHIALEVLSNREYSVQADIDCDGVVTYVDYMLMQMILLNEGLDDSAYVEYLNDYIVK